MFHTLLSLAQNEPVANGLSETSIHLYGWRIATILLIAVVSHVAVRFVRLLLRVFLRTRYGGRRRTKALTLAHFGTSALIFLLYFIACGLVFRELEISLTAYIASATVIGFAVSFGFQGVIQDVITGMTLITSDLLDVGDMVDIGGQVGIVRRMGVRFTVIMNYAGAEVYIPNRNVANVTNYRRGYMRAFLDVRLPEDEDKSREAMQSIEAVMPAVYDQFTGLMLREYEVMGPKPIDGGKRYLRIKFRIWPGQGGLIDGVVKQAVLAEMKKLQPDYADWMVCVQYRVGNEDVLAALPGDEAW